MLLLSLNGVVVSSSNDANGGCHRRGPHSPKIYFGVWPMWCKTHSKYVATTQPVRHQWQCEPNDHGGGFCCSEHSLQGQSAQHGGPQVPAPLWGPSLVGSQRLGHGCPRRWLRLPQCPTLANSEGTQDLGGTKGGCIPCVPGLGGLLALPPCGWWAPPPLAVLALGQGEGLGCWPKGSSILC